MAIKKTAAKTSSSKNTKVTLMAGDGVGPEVTKAVKFVLAEAGAGIVWEECDAGAEVFKKGLATGVPNETIESLIRTGVALKGPLETPVGFGEKSANVTLRKLFETYGNYRPVREIPGIKTPYSGRKLDFVVIRENVEDVYAGIEHMQTPGVAQALKLMTRKGCEKIVRFAFEVARAEGRKSVHCGTKSNILKMTEGMLKKTFEDVSKDYPDIKAQHMIIDNCAHQMIVNPEQFEVIVMSNLHGDILSDMAAGLVGGLGIAQSANIGNDAAIFEAVHGSAPDIAGMGKVNPTAFLFASVLMLRHIGKFDDAERIENALLYTLEQGKVRTGDIVQKGSKAAATMQFAEEVAKNLGKKPSAMAARHAEKIKLPKLSRKPNFVAAKVRVDTGFDVFVESGESPKLLGESIQKLLKNTPFKLKVISNRGVQVYPLGLTSPDLVDHFHCRFAMADKKKKFKEKDMMDFIAKLTKKHRWMHIERLETVDGKSNATKSQGEE